jgi:hypothetical protein
LADRSAADLAIRYLLARFEAPVAIVEQIAFDTELTLGFQADPRYGPLLMFGLGGGDVGDHVDFRRLPMPRGQIAALAGGYVRDPDGLDAMVNAVESFQAFVLGREGIVSIDLNPIVVVGGSVWALDAKIHAI